MAQPAEMIVFDMDGVLVEVTESYRETIVQTVKLLTGEQITRERIQDYKNEGGWNNDWLLSQKIARDLGVEVAYEKVVEEFNRIFFGTVTDGIPDGLMAREVWIPQPGLLEELARKFALSIFTGRLRDEAEMTLRRFAGKVRFDPLIGADNVIHGKPHPEGLNRIREQFPDTELWYVGDTVDDARSARAAGVPFIGIAAPAVSKRQTLLDLFEQEGAVAVVDTINDLPGVVVDNR